jgi:2-succinyl-6-hydroxy-2,4-cyclohexadiene-1-carboxylate synthase
VSTLLVALHGFLGQPSDWDCLRTHVPGVTVAALDLWQVLGQPEIQDWPSATAAVDRALAASVGSTAATTFVVGYSFGARLALGSRLLSSAGLPVRGCCFVSCNAGLADDDSVGREARRAADAAWAARILEEPGASLWAAWDAQPVFGGSAVPASRGALPAPRDVLARALTAASLAGQPDLRPRLRAWPTPVLWVTGERDAKFAAIARELAHAGVPADFVTCGDAGHRVPWDNPGAFAAVLRRWMAAA